MIRIKSFVLRTTLAGTLLLFVAGPQAAVAQLQDPSASKPVAASEPTVSTPVVDKPQAPDFAKLYESLPAESGVFDPAAAYGKAATEARTGYSPLSGQIYGKLSQMLISSDVPAWKDFVDPFFWLAKESGRGEPWFDNYSSNPANANKINLVVPLLFDFEAPQTPARKAASVEVNAAIKKYYSEGNSQAVVDGLLSAAKIDETYALPMFDLGLVQAAGSNWDWAMDAFSKSKSRSPETADRFGQFSDQWIPRLAAYKKLLATPAGLRTYLYWRDLDEAMVLCQVKQFRSAVALAGDAASYKAFQDRPYPYLVGAFAASLAGQPDDVKRMLQLALAHCSNGDDEAAVTALFLSSNSKGG